MKLSNELWKRISTASAQNPLRILTSACIIGKQVGWDDRAYPSQMVQTLIQNPKIKAISFCPENIIMGTPRLFTTIHDGNGFDVLDGKASVKDTDGKDWTERFIYSAEQILQFAQEHQVELAIMMEISDSCGTSAIYLGDPSLKNYQKGPGVSSGILLRHGIPVLGSRDYRTIGKIISLLTGDEQQFEEGIDFIEIDWYQEYFKTN